MKGTPDLEREPFFQIRYPRKPVTLSCWLKESICMSNMKVLDAKVVLSPSFCNDVGDSIAELSLESMDTSGSSYFACRLVRCRVHLEMLSRASSV